MKLTAKQEAFARAYVEAGNASEAYRQCYSVGPTTKPGTIWQSAHRVLGDPKVGARVAELQAAAAKAAVITVESLVAELEEARQAALGSLIAQASAAAAATLGKAKLLGFMTDKIDATVRTKELPASVDEFV